MASLYDRWLGGRGAGEGRIHTPQPRMLTQACTHPDSYTVQHVTITDSEH